MRLTCDFEDACRRSTSFRVQSQTTSVCILNIKRVKGRSHRRHTNRHNAYCSVSSWSSREPGLWCVENASGGRQCTGPRPDQPSEGQASPHCDNSPRLPLVFFFILNRSSMGSGGTLKFALCEVLQFAGLCVPLFIVMQRFAVIVARVKTSAQPPGDASTAYWLIVASSIAYVTSTALLVWVPLKYMVFVKKKFLIGRKKW